MIYYPKNEFTLTKEKISSICNKLPQMLNERVIQAYIFGSVAKGTFHAESDIDLLLVLQNTLTPFFKRALEFQDVLDLFTPIDLIIYTQEEFNSKIQSSPNIGFWGEFKKYHLKLL